MEYLIGFFAGSVLMISAYRFIIRNNLLINKSIRVPYSQSNIISVLKPLGLVQDLVPPPPEVKRQSTDYEKSQTVQVILTDGQAYWIRDNVFYTADIDENFYINNESTRRVDTMSMDKVQLEKIMFIVDRLTEESKNDNSGPRNT
jgi:hypothetical protein